MSAGVEHWAWALAAIFITVTVDTAIAVTDGTYIDDYGDDSVVGVGVDAGGEFLTFRVALDSPREDRDL